MSEQLHWDPELIQRYNRSGPRYTSYPTAVEFKVVENDQVERDLLSQRDQDVPLSLYLHIPFCAHVCYYCGCNKVITRHRDKADTYLEYLAQEIALQAPLFTEYKVKQLHWGGGTPSFLTHKQITTLVALLKEKFDFCDDLEMSIEIDPREIEMDLAEHLFSLGFNRLSLGVQDLDLKVQEAINRVQSTQFIGDFIAHAKDVGFQSINIDLIYGLPHQNLESFKETLNKVQSLDPDRIAIFNYAHVPWMKKHQNLIKQDQLPTADEKLFMFKYATDFLEDKNYIHIGMDHFSKEKDELAVEKLDDPLWSGDTSKPSSSDSSISLKRPSYSSSSLAPGLPTKARIIMPSSPFDSIHFFLSNS